MGLEDYKKNNFIELPTHLKETIGKIFGEIDKKNFDKIKYQFQEQYPPITQETYNLLQAKLKAFKNTNGFKMEGIFKNETELSELINYTFFKKILNQIKKENKEIINIQIYNTLPYTDIKAGIDYYVIIKIKNGNIIFGLDLKNGNNAEDKNFYNIGTKIFIPISFNSNGTLGNSEEILKNIEYSNELWNHIGKHKRAYEIGINPRNQNTINDLVINEILGKVNYTQIEELNIYFLIKDYLEQIISNEIKIYKNGVKNIVEEQNNKVLQILELVQQKEKLKEKAKQKQTEEKKEKIKNQNIGKQQKTPKKIKYETGKNYTPTKIINDIKELLEWDKDNISQQIKRIAKKLNNFPKAKQKFLEIYNTLKESEKRGNKQFYKIIIDTKKITEIKYISKVQKNRIEKIYDLLEDKT